MPRPAPNPWIAKNPGPYSIGDRVSFVMPGHREVGVIVEDRGCLGVKGERVYAIRWTQDEWNEGLVELMASQFQLVERV